MHVHTPALSLSRSHSFSLRRGAHMKCGIVVSTVHVNTVRCALTLIGITLKSYIHTTRRKKTFKQYKFRNTKFSSRSFIIIVRNTIVVVVVCMWLCVCVTFEAKTAVEKKKEIWQMKWSYSTAYEYHVFLTFWCNSTKPVSVRCVKALFSLTKHHHSRWINRIGNSILRTYVSPQTITKTVAHIQIEFPSHAIKPLTQINDIFNFRICE